MRKWLKAIWGFLTNPFGKMEKKPEVFGIKIEVNENLPDKTAFLYSEKDAVKIVFDPTAELDSFLSAINGWVKENPEVSILSTSLWTEGRTCEHTYKRVNSTKEHEARFKIGGLHKDYVCTKCGHSYCVVVSDAAKGLSKAWAAMTMEKKGVA